MRDDGRDRVIRGSRVKLRPALEQDRRAVYEWMARSEVTASMMGPPIYTEAPIPTWDEFSADYVTLFFDGSRPDLGRSYIIEVDGAAIGHVSYSQVDASQRRAELDIWLRSEEVCGRGFGSDALVALTGHLRDVLGLTEFIVRPSARNRRAIRAYTKAGFVPLPLNADQQAERYGPPEHRDTVVLCKTLPAGQGNPADDDRT